MAFVDIFNFKKYITKPSDATTARIGHVNSLYNTLAITTGTYEFDFSVQDNDVTTKAGKIIFDNVNLADGDSERIDLNAPFITENSIPMISFNCATINDALLLNVRANNGYIRIDLLNFGSTPITALTLNYLIIN